MSVAMFEECSKLDVHHPYATNNRAYVCILIKKNKEASEACADAYNVNKSAHNYFRNWAIALLNQKLYGEAVEVVKRAIEADPGCASTGVANVCRELGRLGRDREGARRL